ncbi:uncharacterized protein PgNI_07249, partial [Pyricularia grisea]|uniref:Uncharacterized protein n=1 Tax=Pyricularia grisea TaxID=148305 RepID=A0A6P8B328_PYRGI
MVASMRPLAFPTNKLDFPKPLIAPGSIHKSLDRELSGTP